MNMPRFTAEASLDKAIGGYRPAAEASLPMVLPALIAIEPSPRECYYECRRQGGTRSGCREKCRPPVYA